MYRLIIVLSIFLSLAYADAIAFDKKLIQINHQLLQVEVAATAEQREKGLMFRSSLSDKEGMLFVFDDTFKPCFWMKNTIIPLSLAYIAEDWKIMQLEDLEPLSEQPICAKENVRYALEVPLGWYSQHDIKEGAIVKIVNKQEE